MSSKIQPFRDHHEKKKREARTMLSEMQSMRKANALDISMQKDELEKAISEKYVDHLEALKERRSTVLAASKLAGYTAAVAGGVLFQSYTGIYPW